MPSRLPTHAGRAGIALAVVAALSAGCTSSAPSAPSSPAASPSRLSGTITVFAAASLTRAFTTLGKQFQTTHAGTTVKFSFGSSSTLAQQIIAGAPADVFASASAKNMSQVTAAGDATGPRTFATNRAEIAVAPRSAAKVTNLADLARAGVKVAVCQPQVPCGALARQVLANAKLTVEPVTQGLDVKSTLAYVTSGEVDAAIVYVTDVKAAGNKVKGVPIPAADNADTVYPIAAVKASRNRVLAQAFEELVLSATGRRVLSEAGFARP